MQSWPNGRCVDRATGLFHVLSGSEWYPLLLRFCTSCSSPGLLYPSDEEEEAEPFRPSPAFASGEKLTEVISPTVDPYMKPTHQFKRLRFEI